MSHWDLRVIAGKFPKSASTSRKCDQACMPNMGGNKSAWAVGDHRITSPPIIGNIWISIALHNFLSDTGEICVQITRCWNDMCKIVRGRYLVWLFLPSSIIKTILWILRYYLDEIVKIFQNLIIAWFKQVKSSTNHSKNLNPEDLTIFDRKISTL